MTENESTRAASLADEGKSLYSSKRYLQAAECFSRSAELYQDRDDRSLAAEMRNNQAVALLMVKKPHQALKALEGTSETFREAGDSLKQGMALANLATAYKDIGEYENALSHYSRAAEVFLAAKAFEMHLQTMQSISSLKLKARDLTGAIFAMQAGLTALEKPTLRQRLLRNLFKIPNQLLNR